MAKAKDRLIGRDVGRFRVEELVGRGGMGAVYRATDTSLGRTVALKVLMDGRATDEGFRRRFLQESKTLASVDHPNIVPVFEAGEADGELYIAMRFVRGPDLSKLIATSGGLSPAASAAIVAQIAEALDAAHAVGLIHRDVKPANILVVPGSAPSTHHAYLTDFGLTKALGSTSGLTEAGQLVGTPGYLAPEQIQGKPIDHRVDVYSLGCVLFDCLTGAVPFPRDTAITSMFAHVTEPPPRPSEARADVPEAFDAVIATALAKDPAERYERAGLLGEAALAAVGGSAASNAIAAAAGVAAAAAGVAGVAAAGAPPTVIADTDGAGAPPTVIADSHGAGAPATVIASVAAAAGPGTPFDAAPDAPAGAGSGPPPPPPAEPGQVTPPPGLASAGILAAAGEPTILESGPPAIPPIPPGPPAGGSPDVPPGGGGGGRGRRVGVLAAVGGIAAVLALGGIAFGMASGALRFGPAAEATATPPPSGRTGDVRSPSPEPGVSQPPADPPTPSPSPSPTLSPSLSPDPTLVPTAAPTPGPTQDPPARANPTPIPPPKDTQAPSGGDIVLAGGKGVTTSTKVNVQIQPRPVDPSKVTWYAISNQNQRPAGRKAFDASFTWPLVAGNAGKRTVYVWFADARLNWTRTPVTDTITFDHAPRDSSYVWDLRNRSGYCGPWIDFTMPGYAVTDADGNGTLHIVRAWGDGGDYELRSGNTVVRTYNPQQPFGELSFYFNYIAEDNHGVRVTARADYKVGPCP